MLVARVVVLAVLLLQASFRSVATAGKAALLHLLSMAAAYGVIALVLQGGWAGQLVGIDVRVSTTAAAVVAVFMSFVPTDNLTLELIGVGLASAVDATVVLMLLVPSIMRLHGRYASWLPLT
jgi:RND superfamily putative drug exporter